MKQILLIFVAALFVHAGHSQTDATYLSEAKAFLAFIRSSEIKTEHFVITSQPEAGELKSCATLYYDTSLFKQQDKAAINNALETAPIPKWTTDLLSPAVIIEQDTVIALFKDYKNRGWKYYHAAYAPGLYRISAPVFLKNYTQALLYIGYACDNSCGEGYIKLYEKKAGQWKAVRNFCMWTK